MAYQPSGMKDFESPAEPGVYLVVHVTRESAELIKVARVKHAPRRLLRAPRLTKATVDAFEDDASELVCAAVSDHGAVTESFGWDARPEAFVETEDHHEIDTRLWDWDARWRIPFAESARYLQFYRSDFARSQDGLSTFTQTSLGVYDLKPGGPDLPHPPFPVPTPQPPIPIPLPPDLAPREFRRKIRFQDSSRAYTTVSLGGYIKSAETLVYQGDPADKFNIVILGDGFQDADLAVFDERAALVQEALTTTLPFSNLVNRINVYKVSAVSTDSGITDCPTCSVPKNSYFRTAGCFNNSGSPAFIGPNSPVRIRDAVTQVIPEEYAHLIITIVNCPIYGGGSPPEFGLAFVNVMPNKSLFKKVATHESGHVIAKLCEEYNACNKKQPLRIYPNETTQAEVDAGTVWWQALAMPGEVVGGKLATIHRCGDPVDVDCQAPDPLNTLGAFWGCHNGNDSDAGAACATGTDCDSRGMSFYRSQARCRMRNPLFAFCRACSYLLSDAILAVST